MMACKEGDTHMPLNVNSRWLGAAEPKHEAQHLKHVESNEY